MFNLYHFESDICDMFISRVIKKEQNNWILKAWQNKDNKDTDVLNVENVR